MKPGSPVGLRDILDQWLAAMARAPAAAGTIAVLVLCLLASEARAVLIYEEQVSGDLDGAFIGSLEAGTNVVSGRTQYGINSTEDIDGFQVAIAVGSSLELVRLAVTVGPLPPPVTFPPNFPVGTASLDGAPVLFAGTDSFEFLPPFSASLIAAAVAGASFPSDLIGVVSGAIDYRWEFVVAQDQAQAIAEPAAAGLLAAGLLGLAAVAFVRGRAAQRR